MIRDALLVCRKDLKIEWRSRVVFSQVLPFGAMVVLLFAIAVSADYRLAGTANRSVLTQIGPGLFWTVVVFSVIYTLGRSFAIESSEGNYTGLQMAGLDPSAIFLGKAVAVFMLIAMLLVPVGAAAAVLYELEVKDYILLAVTAASGLFAMSVAGTLYAAVSVGSQSKDTLLPLLLLPAITPIVLAAARASEGAMFGDADTGWGWVSLLGVFCALYTGAGALAFGSLMEDA